MRLNTISFTILSSVSLVLPCTLHAQQRTAAPAEFVEWLPVTEADQQAKSPVVDKDAGAEVLSSRVHVSDEYLSGGGLQRVLYHYVRVKVFNAGAKQNIGTICRIANQAGSTMSPGGPSSRTARFSNSTARPCTNGIWSVPAV